MDPSSVEENKRSKEKEFKTRGGGQLEKVRIETKRVCDGKLKGVWAITGERKWVATRNKRVATGGGGLHIATRQVFGSMRRAGIELAPFCLSSIVQAK